MLQGRAAEGESFQEAISGILVSAQVFGLLPVRGVRGRSPAQLRFERLSARVAWALLLFLVVLMVELVSLRHMCLTLSADTFGVIGQYILRASSSTGRGAGY